MYGYELGHKNGLFALLRIGNFTNKSSDHDDCP